MRLLVVEDEGSIRSALARGLGQYGHRIETASCLSEARALVAKRHPEALLSDLKLPDGNGLDLAEEIGVPFILMTGYGTFDDAVRAMRLGCHDFFTKPVTIKEVCRALDHLAGRRAGGPTVVDAAQDGRLRLTHPTASGFCSQTLQSCTVAWADAAQAKAAFAQLHDVVPALPHRQVAAELMQTTSQGRLVVNLHDDLWSAWLDATVIWSQAVDCRMLLEDLCRRCLWTKDGALVEYGHA
jgi:DNA-binding response OmpR family regulator